MVHVSILQGVRHSSTLMYLKLCWIVPFGAFMTVLIISVNSSQLSINHMAGVLWQMTKISQVYWEKWPNLIM